MSAAPFKKKKKKDHDRKNIAEWRGSVEFLSNLWEKDCYV